MQPMYYLRIGTTRLITKHKQTPITKHSFITYKHLFFFILAGQSTETLALIFIHAYFNSKLN